MVDLPKLFSRLFIVAFAATGLLWIGAAVSGEGVVSLIIPGILSLLIAYLMLRRRRGSWVRLSALVVGVYNLVLYAAQSYVMLTPSGLGLVPYAGVLGAVYVAVAAIFLIVVVSTFTAGSMWISSEPEPSEAHKERRDSQ